MNIKKMYKNIFVSLKILLIIQFILVTPAEVLSKQMNLHLCSNNNTIGVQITTKDNAGDVSCQCQAGPAKEPWLREDYVHTPGIGSHKLHTEGKTWNEARKICIEENGHLAIINSVLEDNILAAMLKKAEGSITNTLNKEEAFIGIHDMFQEGEWVTVFGESIYSTGYASWSSTYWSGQPDNRDGRQNCGAILTFTSMDDVNCNDKFAFFCELPLAC